ncbi:MAG TPA: acyl-CoA dehydrogenase [Stellaceae bacterium]|nr:acyl-CoA dehydrogenase [Stellaceae bacterium]
MSDYAAPLADMRFVLEEIAALPELERLGFEQATPDVVEAVLAEAGKLASEVLAPLNRSGDIEHSVLENGVVRTPRGFKEAYASFVAGGWNAISGPAEYGGQGLPHALATATNEMWTSANLAFALCPMLTLGAIELLAAHGSAAQRQVYLGKIVSGEWTCAMNLTEPQAGTDLGALRTRALRNGDHYLLSGQKIFITYGEHDFTPNIVHLVLARLPDAPPGSRGISCFLVPKYLVNADGSLGRRNDIRCVSLEHKLGIHASPTCVLAYGDAGGAVGYLIGDENEGLAGMFTMMNHARLGVGLQGVAIAERAYQQARAYARQRVQGRPVDAKTNAPLPILHHPDVRRMLLSMRATTEATRALAYYTAAAIDRTHHHPDEKARQAQLSRVDLLTPVVKAWSTDLGVEAASINIQVHGGMGFIEETGAAQLLRDVRIAPIYEGTNGVQANDLVGRKLIRDGGAAMRELIRDMRATAADLAAAPGEAVSALRRPLADGIDALEQASGALIAGFAGDPARALAGAVPYLKLTGLVAGGWVMAQSALAALRRLGSGTGDARFHRAKLATARFYAETYLATAPALLPAIAGGGTVMDFDLEEI